MWEKIKNSRFADHVRNSRATYVTILTLVLAVSVLITVTAISNRAKKKGAQDDANPPSQSDSTGNGDQQSNPSTGKPGAVLPGDLPGADDKQEQPSGEQTPEADGEQDTAATLPELSLPVSGVIAKGYDSTLQVYSATMGDYRIHLGLDMTTAEDAPVYAAADGVVSRIWEDTLMGKCIAVSHAGDCYTIYKNLNPELPEGVTVGVDIKAGELLGQVGESAVLELAEEPHLHFEMTVGGLSVDPLDYFSEQAIAALQKDNSHETSATPAGEQAE